MRIISLIQRLRVIYKPYLAHLYSQDWPADVLAPLLVHVFDDYARMPRKVLFVGQ
jgi:hypothetical protein